MARLFISYARRDGAVLAQRLEADLRLQGHEPWLDRKGIEGGDSWSREIEDAINTCESMLAVLTAGSYESSICRGEQLRALRRGKRILALLAQGDAERPVYLEESHYLDFSDERAYAARLAELQNALRNASGIGWDQLSAKVRQRLEEDESLQAPMRVPQADTATWAGLQRRAAVQLGRFRDGLAGRGNTPGLYEPALYVARSAEEEELGRFADGSALALVLIGQPGVGKTNLLAHWAEQRVQAGDAVLVYPCERLDALRADGEIARDLGLDDALVLAKAWPVIDTLAQQAGQTLWLVFDGLNDVRGSQDAARQLLLAIDSLVSRLPGTAVKVVASCTQSTWQRMDRQEPLRLAWRRYHRSRDDADVLVLGGFTPEQAEAAYALYQPRFELALGLADLPPALRTRLREPVLLRLLAEALQGQAAPGDSEDFDTRVFKRYYETRIRRREDQAFVDDLAAEMLSTRNAALPLLPLLRHPTLGPVLQDTGSDSPATRLLDEGVLSEVRGDLFDDDRLRFNYPLVGAYAIVRLLLRQQRPFIDMVRELAAMADELPLAWDAAVTLMVLRGDAASYGALAAADDPELRELALESLVRQHGADAPRTRAVLDSLLDTGVSEQQRTALRAAFNIGPAARDLLVRGALSDSAALRNAVRDTLYLIWNGVSRPPGAADGGSNTSALYFIWRQAPDFTHGLMKDLVARLSWLNPLEARRILAFVLDLTITIYVNHCERPDVVENTAALFHELSVERLHLDKLVLGAALERVVFRVVASVFADRLLRWMLLDDEANPKAFFTLAASERALLGQAAALLDPRSDLDAAKPLLLQMLGAAVPVLRGSATLVLAVHMLADPAGAENTLRALFDALDARGRTWLLAGFSVLLPDTPAAWVPLLETLTQRMLDDTRSGGSPAPLMPAFDGFFVPLGLAYAKRGSAMPLFLPLLQQAGQHPARAARLIESLGVVGFYHPQAVLGLLRQHAKALLGNPITCPALVQALATMRTLHFDPVDTLLAQAGASEGQRRDVVAGADMARVQQFMRLLGYYNNAVHFCVHYPRMRRGLAACALTLLATAPNAREFIAGYAARAIAMARESNFDLRAWTEAEADEAPDAGR